MQNSQQIGQLARQHAALLSARLSEHRAQHPPVRRPARRFTSGEVAALLGVKDAYLRKLSLEGRGPRPETGQGGRRLYTSGNILALRHMLDAGAKTPGTYLPGRRRGDALQVIALTGATAGTGTTTIAAHLAQKCALAGFRVLAIDLDPNGGLSALLTRDTDPDPETPRQTGLAGLDLLRSDTTQLKTAVAREESDYDLAIIDCPIDAAPAALGVATRLLMTARPDPLHLMALCRALGGLSDVSGHADLLYLFTRHDPADAGQAQMASFMRALFGDHVLSQAIPELPVIADAGVAGQTLYDIDRPRADRPAHDRALEAMNAVADDLQRRIRQAWGRTPSIPRPGGG